MNVALMIWGQEGVTWPQWVALARAAAAESAQRAAVTRMGAPNRANRTLRLAPRGRESRQMAKLPAAHGGGKAVRDTFA